MKRISSALLFPLILACMLLPLGCLKAEADPEASDGETTAAESVYTPITVVSPDGHKDPGTTENVESLERYLCEMLEAEAFELKTIRVDTCDCFEHDSLLGLSGTVTKDGAAKEWSESYSIPYSTFLLLYKVRSDWVLYNTEPRENETQILTINDVALQTILEALA